MNWMSELERYIVSHGAPLFAAGFLASVAAVAGAGFLATLVPVVGRTLATFLAEPALDMLVGLAGGIAAAYTYRNSAKP